MNRATASAASSRFCALLRPLTALRGRKSWSPSSSQCSSMAERKRIGLDLLARGEGVAGAVADQRRHGEVREVRGAQLLRPARRMERVAEADQPADVAGTEVLLGHHAGDPTAHRLAADEEPRQVPRHGDRLGILALQGLGLRRRLPLADAAGRHVAEFETGGADAALGETGAEIVHPRRVHRRAGAMRQQQVGRRVGGAGEEQIHRAFSAGEAEPILCG